MGWWVRGGRQQILETSILFLNLTHNDSLSRSRSLNHNCSQNHSCFHFQSRLMEESRGMYKNSNRHMCYSDVYNPFHIVRQS